MFSSPQRHINSIAESFHSRISYGSSEFFKLTHLLNPSWSTAHEQSIHTCLSWLPLPQRQPRRPTRPPNAAWDMAALMLDDAHVRQQQMCVRLCVTGEEERVRGNAFTHHIDGWHGPDAVDIYAHVDDCWFHCKSQKEEEWVRVAAHVVGGKREIYIWGVSVVFVICQCFHPAVMCDWASNCIHGGQKIKSVIVFEQLLSSITMSPWQIK